ncbi:MAG: hypothetical protein ACM3UU_05250 [Ignavibacteriales bacterium]
MNAMDNFLGMPWNDLIELMKVAIILLYTKYLFMTIVVYIMYVIVLAIMDETDMLMQYMFYFTIVFLLLARPIVGLFAWFDWFLKGCGINLPSFFALLF